MIFTAKKFKWKYLVISLVLIAIITATTAFSVSYAKWVGGSESLTANLGTGTTDGTWGKPNTIETIKWPEGYNEAISYTYNGKNYSVGLDPQEDFWQCSDTEFQFEINVLSGQEIFFKLGSFLIYYMNSDNHQVEKYTIFGQEYYFVENSNYHNPENPIYAPKGTDKDNAEIIANPSTGSFIFNRDGAYSVYVHYKEKDAANNYISIARLGNLSDKTIDLTKPQN